MERVFNKSTNLFSEKNYMEVLNRVVIDIGEELLVVFAPSTTIAPEVVCSLILRFFSTSIV